MANFFVSRRTPDPRGLEFVMPGLVPGIHVLATDGRNKDVDGRVIQREDALLPGHRGNR
jgi:hypothetical protein